MDIQQTDIITAHFSTLALLLEAGRIHTSTTGMNGVSFVQPATEKLRNNVQPSLRDFDCSWGEDTSNARQGVRKKARR